MGDLDDDDFDSLETPTSRVYVHDRCGGETRVGGHHFTHICDPFWPCTETYCCLCEGFAPLHEVRWVETEELVSDYRRRLRSQTPALVKIWRLGLGFLVGGAIGALIGPVIVKIAQLGPNKNEPTIVLSGLVGALVVYLLGTIVLNRSLGIVYRRRR